MRDAGATVRLFSMADDAAYGNPAEREGLAVLPIETARQWAAQSDLVVANTCVAGPWVRDYLAGHPEGAERLLWWIHENSPEEFAQYLPGTEAVRHVAYDSHDERDAWAPFNIGTSSHRFVLHPGNRTELLEAAHAHTLPWPRMAHGANELVRERVDRKTARHRLGISDDTFLLCCTGTIQPRKGQLWLVETVARLLANDPSLPVRVLLVGFFDEARRRETLSELKGTARTAVGDGRLLINHTPDVGVFLRASDAFVMNSQGRGEPFGRVTIEAMAFGLPVLGTSAGGTTEIVVDGVTGLLHPVGEAGLEVLGANIVRLVRDRSLARQLGQAGQERADDHFTAARVYRELGHVVDVIIGDARASDPGAPTTLRERP
jgi:glycosyltransferase involved in cell wall biosynthesis